MKALHSHPSERKTSQVQLRSMERAFVVGNLQGIALGRGSLCIIPLPVFLKDNVQKLDAVILAKCLDLNP